MKVLKTICMLLLLLIIAAGGCVFYAFNIEPFRLTVKEIRLAEKQEDKLEVKIAQISDLHIKENFTSERLSAVVEKINEQNPDIIIFTGDLYDNYSTYHEDDKVIATLQKLQARYAKIAIWGNRDHGGGAARQYDNIIAQAGFTLLKNQNWYITLANEKKILLTGLDDSMLGNPKMPDATKIYDAAYQILLSHEPDSVEDYLDYDYDIALSGHSHGGQINIPFLPFINKAATAVSSLSSKYSGGMYQFEKRSLQKLYVNTGIGTTHIFARFGVIPEITVFQLYL